jgi:putative Mn2+ efflux pump MntP
LEAYLTYLTIAFALALDAFAVSLAAGAYFGKASSRQKFRLSFHFGLFQFLMPLLGWILGATIVKLVENFDHWVAALILAIIGIKMIHDGMSDESSRIDKDISKGLTLITLSVATSIDALAIGFSLGIIKESIVLPSIIIGIVAAAMSLLGVKLGEKLSSKFGNRVAIAGGILLILIGLKILAEHMGWAFWV